MGSFSVQGGSSNNDNYWSQFPTHGPGAPGYMPASNGAPPGYIPPGQLYGGGASDPRVTTQPMPSQPGPSDGGGAQGDYQQEFLQAAQELGISPQQFRSNPAVMDQVTNYLNQKYPGQNWTNGGARAGDWVSANGQGFDVLPAGDANWQWLSDPANSTAGSTGNLGAIGAGAGLAGSAFGLAPGQSVMDLVRNLPGYQFARDEAMNSIQRGAAAHGTLLTGGLQKRLGEVIGNAVAGPAYQSQVGNLFNLATLGENAAAGTGAAMGQYGNNASNLITGIGNSQAAGTAAGGAAWGNALGNLGNIAASSYAATHPPNPYNANQYGYNPNGVNGYGVNMINPDNG